MVMHENEIKKLISSTLVPVCLSLNARGIYSITEAIMLFASFQNSVPRFDTMLVGCDKPSHISTVWRPLEKSSFLSHVNRIVTKGESQPDPAMFSW